MMLTQISVVLVTRRFCNGLWDFLCSALCHFCHLRLLQMGEVTTVTRGTCVVGIFICVCVCVCVCLAVAGRWFFFPMPQWVRFSVMLCGEERSVVVSHFPPGGLTTKHFSGAHTYTKPHTQTQKFRKYIYILHTSVFPVNFFPPESIRCGSLAFGLSVLIIFLWIKLNPSHYLLVLEKQRCFPIFH